MRKYCVKILKGVIADFPVHTDNTINESLQKETFRWFCVKFFLCLLWHEQYKPMSPKIPTVISIVLPSVSGSTTLLSDSSLILTVLSSSADFLGERRNKEIQTGFLKRSSYLVILIN